MEKLIDTQKTRRRIEDVLRKSDPETIIGVANLLGVEIAKSFLIEKIPGSELLLADLWEEWEGKRVQFKSVISGNSGLTLRGIKILKDLPPRFKTYAIHYSDHPNADSLWREFLTPEAAERFEKHLKETGSPKSSEPFVKKIPRNVIQMRICLRAFREHKRTAHLEPDEEEVFKQLEKVLFKKT